MGFDNLTDTNWILRLNGDGTYGSLHCEGTIATTRNFSVFAPHNHEFGFKVFRSQGSQECIARMYEANESGLLELVGYHPAGVQNHTIKLDSRHGTVTITGAYYPACDDRIKSYESDLSNATATLLQLHPKRYEKHPGLRLDEADEAPDLTGVSHFTEVGFIAQDVEQVPELQFMVSTMEGSDTKTIAPMNLIGYLVKGFQEMNARLAAAETRLATLEAQ
jgi:hypothetical protein